MVETRKLALTEENWQKIDKLLAEISPNDFLEFCLMNEIVEKGIEILQFHHERMS